MQNVDYRVFGGILTGALHRKERLSKNGFTTVANGDPAGTPIGQDLILVALGNGVIMGFNRPTGLFVACGSRQFSVSLNHDENQFVAVSAFSCGSNRVRSTSLRTTSAPRDIFQQGKD